jgi:protein disulfide-isomerase A6
VREPSGGARRAQGLVTVGAVDCDEEANKPLCARYGVKGFPALKLFGPQRRVNPYTRKAGKPPADYSGAPPLGP